MTKIEFTHLTSQELREELEDAAKLCDVEIRLITDINLQIMALKLIPKNQQLNVHTEHSVEISMAIYQPLGFKQNVDVLIRRVWNNHKRNFYDYLGDIKKNYEEFKKNLSSDDDQPLY